MAFCFYMPSITKDKKYKRPTSGTITDTLQDAKKINKLLEGYERADDISNVDVNTHLRYVTLVDNKEKFRLGGFLYKKFPDYVVLANRHPSGKSFHNAITWIVQKKHKRRGKSDFETVFYYKLSKLDKCKIALMKQQQEIIKLQKKLKRKLQKKARDNKAKAK